MIFITLGSQKFQFNRLLECVDNLIDAGKIKEEVVAQVGYSDYIPRNYVAVDFLDRENFQNNIDLADIIITHGGTGAIITAVKKEKKVIAIPRLAKYKEHVDDHQLQIVNQFSELGFICACLNCEELEKAIDEVRSNTYLKYVSNSKQIQDSLIDFIDHI